MKPIHRNLLAGLAAAAFTTITFGQSPAENPTTPPPPHEKQAPAVEKNLKVFDTLDFDVFSNQKWDRLHESHAKDIVGPGHDDVFRVAFVQPVPLLVAEDVEVQGVEDLEVLLDGRRLLLVRRRRRRGVLRRRLPEGDGGESGGCEAGQEIAMNRFHEWFLSREVRYAGTCSRWRRDHPAAGVPVGVELDERRVVRKAGSSPTGSRGRHAARP